MALVQNPGYAKKNNNLWLENMGNFGGDCHWNVCKHQLGKLQTPASRIEKGVEALEKENWIVGKATKESTHVPSAAKRQE